MKYYLKGLFTKRLHVALFPILPPNKVYLTEIHNFFISFSAIYLYLLLVWVFVCLFVTNKRQNGLTDRALKTFVGPHVTPGKIKIEKEIP